MFTWLPILPINEDMMNELVPAKTASDWRRMKALVLDSVSSPITRRVYNLGLDEFFEWFGREPRSGFNKATVSTWRVALEARGLGSISINVRITAVRKLAVEAADNGLLAPELAAGITRIKGVKSKGVRVGNWLSVRQAQTLLNTPDVSTKKGLRDRAMLAVLLGCGLRRSEVASLTLKHIQQRDGRWCIVDLVGKHGRVRTIPMPTWVKVTIDGWTQAALVSDGHVLRPVNRADEVQGERMSEKVVWQLLQPYATAAGVPGIAPHDLRRAVAQKCVELPVGSLSRSSCFLDTLRFKRLSGTSERNRSRARAERRDQAANCGFSRLSWPPSILQRSPTQVASGMLILPLIR
jgi:site-specific recombinase XerD